MAYAKSIGAATIGVSCTPDSELSRHVEIPIEAVVGPEVVAGSTRLRAGTATKMVLNMLSTGAMVKLGHVYGNLMVNVQARNEKLVARARRIIAEGAETTPDEAARLFEESGHQVKLAIIMGKLQIKKDDAAALLNDAGGRIRVAVQQEREKK